MKLENTNYVNNFEKDLNAVKSTITLMMNSNGIYEEDVRIVYIANKLVRCGYVLFGKEWVRYETMKHVNSCKIMEIIVKMVKYFNE